MISVGRVEQLLGLAEAGHDVAGQDQVRVEVADDEHAVSASGPAPDMRHHRRRELRSLSRTNQNRCSILLVSRPPCDARPRDHRLLRRCRLGGVHPPAAARPARLRRPRPARPSVLHDIDPRRLDLAEGLARIAVERARPAAPRSGPTADRRAALDGADFVINTINVGGHAATVTDFEVPARFGLRQTIADTLGVGGIFRGLRTFPVLDGSPTDMRAVCPDAWLLNYTNPMAMNIQYLAAAHPDLKVLGLCHSVFWTVHDLCELIDVPLDEVTFHSAGVNHQAWVLRWERDGAEPLPAAGRADRRRPRAAPAGPRRHVPPARLLPDRDQRALQRVRPVVPARRRRDRAAAHPGRRLPADQRGQRRRRSRR